MRETVKGREIYKILGTKNQLFSLRATPHFYKSAGESRSTLKNYKEVLDKPCEIIVTYLQYEKILF